MAAAFNPSRSHMPFFQLGAEVSKGAHRPGKFSHPHVFGGVAKARDIALGLGVPVGQLETKCDGLGVNAVGAADHGRVFKFPGAPFQHGGKLFQIGGDNRRRLLDEQGLRSVDYIVRSQAVVKPAGVRADDFGHGGGEGDDIVANFRFDFGNPVQIEVSPLANGAGGILRHHAGFGQCFRGRDFDRQPGTEAILVAPDAAHVGAGVAWDQGVSPAVSEKCGLGIVNGRGGW